MNKQFNIDTFGEIMDKWIYENDIQLLIEIPEGTNEAIVKDNCCDVGVMQFYILLTAMKQVYKNIYDKLLDPVKEEEFIDGILELVKEDLMSVAKESTGEEPGEEETR